MPEAPEAIAFEERIKKSLRDYSYTHNGCPMSGIVKIYPQCAALGTRQKPYKSFSSYRSGYFPAMEPGPSFPPDHHIDQRLKETNYQGLDYLMRPKVPGPIVLRQRGRLLLIGAGFHLFVVHFGLEGHIIEVPRATLEEIEQQCIEGPNDNPSKRRKLRCFKLPQHLIEPAARDQDDRSICLFAAIISEAKAFIMIDFCRLIRIHAVSLDRLWQQDDLEPTSEIWSSECSPLWSEFSNQPDWVYETAAAENRLRTWQESVIAAGPSRSSIIKDMRDDTFGAFGGIGCHLRADFLHMLLIHPAKPSFEICSNRSLFISVFLDGLKRFMLQFRSQAYIKYTCNRPNSPNPFAYSQFQNDAYAPFLKIFRRSTVKISYNDYMKLTEQGWFDPKYTINNTVKYDPPSSALLPHHRKEVEIPVFAVRIDTIKTFTIMRANVPSHWTTISLNAATDVGIEGLKTTIGPVEFRELKSNKIDPERAAEIQCVRGRPKKVKGRIGRPPKVLTKAECERLSKEPYRIQEKTESCLQLWNSIYQYDEVLHNNGLLPEAEQYLQGDEENIIISRKRTVELHTRLDTNIRRTRRRT